MLCDDCAKGAFGTNCGDWSCDYYCYLESGANNGEANSSPCDVGATTTRRSRTRREGNGVVVSNAQEVGNSHCAGARMELAHIQSRCDIAGKDSEIGSLCEEYEAIQADFSLRLQEMMTESEDSASSTVGCSFFAVIGAATTAAVIALYA